MGKRRRQRRSFTPEFKAEAVKVVQQSGKSVAMVARELDLTVFEAPEGLSGPAGGGPGRGVVGSDKVQLGQLTPL